MEGEAENILSMEKFDGMIENLECSDTQMKITFDDEESYQYAQHAWDWVNGADNHSFVMVAGKGDCGNVHRQPYVIGHIEYDDASVTAYLDARAAEWSDIAHSYISKPVVFHPTASASRSEMLEPTHRFHWTQTFPLRAKQNS